MICLLLLEKKVKVRKYYREKNIAANSQNILAIIEESDLLHLLLLYTHTTECHGPGLWPGRIDRQDRLLSSIYIDVTSCQTGHCPKLSAY